MATEREPEQGSGPRQTGAQVRQNASAHRFELAVGAELSVLDYVETPGKLVLLHTEVPHALRRQGIAGQLAQAALQYARSNRLMIAPRCPFVAKYLQTHPGYEDLISLE